MCKRTLLTPGLLLLLSTNHSICQAQVLSRSPDSALQTPIGPVPGKEDKEKPKPNPFTDKSAVEQGRTAFIRYNCYGCHGGHAGGGMGPSLRGKMDHSDAHYFQTIALGREMGMPAWGTRLSETDIWKLVAYVKSLGTPKEPDAPK